MRRWTRRSLLAGGVVVALPVAGLAGGKLACRLAGLPKPAGVKQTLLGTFYPDTAAAQALGEAYLQQTGTTAAACLHRLNKEKGIAGALASGCRNTTLSAVERACREDFRNGRVHCVNRWVLAQTELDIAALATT